MSRLRFAIHVYRLTANFYRMENTKLNSAISFYCKENSLQKTFKALTLAGNEIDHHEKRGDLSVAKLFEKYFAKEHEGEGLSFTFNLQNNRSQLRKRLLEQSVQTVVNKKAKVERVKERKNDVPSSFLSLLDELGLDRKKATLLYENKDQWRYEKSDRLIYCTELGKFLSKKLCSTKVNCF